MAKIEFYDLKDVERERDARRGMEGIDLSELQFLSDKTIFLGKLPQEEKDEILMAVLKHNEPCFVKVDGALIQDGRGLDKGTNGTAIHLFNVSGGKRYSGERPKEGETWVFTPNNGRGALTKYSTDKFIHQENGFTFCGYSFLYQMSPKAQIEAIKTGLVSDYTISEHFENMSPEVKLSCMDKINQLIANDRIGVDLDRWSLPEEWKFSKDAALKLLSHHRIDNPHSSFETLIDKLPKEALLYPEFLNKIKSDCVQNFITEIDSDQMNRFKVISENFDIIENFKAFHNRISELATPEERQKLNLDKYFNDITKAFLDSLNIYEEKYKDEDYYLQHSHGRYIGTEDYVKLFLNNEDLEKPFFPEDMYTSEDFRADVSAQKLVIPWSLKHLSENKDLIPQMLEIPRYNRQIFDIALMDFESKEMKDIRSEIDEYVKKVLDEYEKGTLQISLEKAIPSSYAKQDPNGTIFQFFDKHPEALTSPEVYKDDWLPEKIFKIKFVESMRTQDTDFTRTIYENGEPKEVPCTLTEAMAVTAKSADYPYFNGEFIDSLKENCEEFNKALGVDINEALNTEFFNDYMEEYEAEQAWYDEQYGYYDEEEYEEDLDEIGDEGGQEWE